MQEMIRNLVSHHVAVTSTLPVYEAGAPGRPPLQQRTLDVMSAESAQSYLTARAKVPLDSPRTALLPKEMDFEAAFVKAGGLLLAGPDPTGNGGVLKADFAGVCRISRIIISLCLRKRRPSHRKCFNA